MKSVNAAVQNAIRSSYQVQAQPRLLAEWNMNRYFDTTVSNTPSEDTDGFDIEVFPIESIVEPNRPSKGILKARTDEAMVTDLDRSGTSRYYIASDDDVYHYWTSPAPSSNGSGVFTTTVRPQVIYSADVSVNKVVIKVENFWATPNSFYVRTTTSATPVWNDTESSNDWKIIATSPTINNKGEIILYWNGTGWSSTKPSNLVAPPLRVIRGLMIDVRSMTAGRDLNGNVTTYRNRRRVGSTWIEESVATTGTNSFFNLIEISARREVDLSSNLISVSDEFDISAESDLYPIGTITTNTATVTLSNLYSVNGVQNTGYFNNDNPDSPYRGLCQPSVKMNLEYVYTVDGTDYPVQQFHLYTEEWEGQKDHEISLTLNDASKFLEEITPPPAMYENLTVPQIFQRVLDSSGFVDWSLEYEDRIENHIIPVFWMSGEKNVWEILNDLASGTQTAIYFDGYGKLRIKTREAAFNDSLTPSWNFRGENAGTDLADIIELNEGGDVGANHLTITYQTTKWDKWNSGTPSMQKVWEPEDTTTLRGTQLIQTMANNSMLINISPKEATIWPYEGMVQIEGEIIKYSGKRYIYYTGTNGQTRNVVTVKSVDEKNKYGYQTPPEYRGKNQFTGGLVVAPDGRGYWNSDQRAHSVDLGSYNVRRVLSNTLTTNAPGLYHDKAKSCLKLASSSKAKGDDVLIATNGANNSTFYNFYGTKFKFLKENSLHQQRAGLVINGQGTNTQSGYFVDLIYTTDNKVRQKRNELTVYSYSGGKLRQLDFGKPVAVALNTFYQIDVAFQMIGPNHRLTIYINGRFALQVDIDSASNAFVPANGQFGMFVRGESKAEFEYLYGIARDERLPDDDSTFFDLVRGGYTGDHFIREFIWGWKTRKKRKKKKWTKEKYRWNRYYFDEFGPYVHEVREFNVKFEPKPVQNSRLYMTNDWGAICTEYRSTPFGAYFVLTNVSRHNEVVHGDDNITFGGSRTVPQVLTAIGRILVMSDEETVEKKNEASIKLRGKVEAELSSPWIQSKAMATDIADWMDKHWGDGADEITLKVFGNPLVELTDVVSVTYAEKFMAAATHKYYVTNVNTSFESGVETSVRLRRV